tara:strand:- start:16029 stop:16307 length:279 start_codon:yes stop_codon:yes gene_type:complete
LVHVAAWRRSILRYGSKWHGLALGPLLGWPSLFVISDWEIWACAEHGEDALIIAAMRADKQMSEGDMQGARTIQMIVKRINQLLQLPSGLLH